ncbi:MAG TPA: VCBS repeat-containing protein [Pirellulales bacterium]|nr:VCBS repeat-containing protein [Pirellulales bacterium]
MNTTKLTASAVQGAFLIGAILAGGTSARGQESASTRLLPPTRVEAAGLPIDIETGGTAPWYADFDRDGRADLLVGQLEGGKLRIYRNLGSNEQPRFDAYEWFKAGAAGDAGQVFPSPQTGLFGGPVGFAPQLVDFDGDGLEDVLSCTGNGGIVVFRRQKDGSFAEGESLKRPDGLEIVGTPGATVHAADWDGDGDLDLGIAVQRGGISLLRNTGSRRQPTFGDPEPFKSDDDVVSARFGSAAPVMADWDGDGLIDLVVGSGDGSVTFYRHVGAAKDTTLAEGSVLVPPAFHDEEDASRPGSGARPCVCDFNGDGRLDLLVGGVRTSVVTPEIQLTDEDREHDAALEKKLASLSKKFSVERKELDDETGSPREKRLEGLRVISSQMRAMRRELTRPPPQPIVTIHGHLWIYLAGQGR